MAMCVQMRVIGKEAQKIARQGQEFVKNMRTKEWMDEMYKKYFVRQLGEIVNA